MHKEIFKSDRYFILFDFFASHGQLLLRSAKNDSQKENIDVIFFDTSFLQLFTMLHGITIRTVDKREINNYDSVSKYLRYETADLFEIESANEKYYVVASLVKVFKNELDFNETSLGMLYKGRDKEIAASR